MVGMFNTKRRLVAIVEVFLRLIQLRMSSAWFTARGRPTRRPLRETPVRTNDNPSRSPTQSDKGSGRTSRHIPVPPHQASTI
jgi:hypothetical protein